MSWWSELEPTKAGVNSLFSPLGDGRGDEVADDAGEVYFVRSCFLNYGSSHCPEGYRGS